MPWSSTAGGWAWVDRRAAVCAVRAAERDRPGLGAGGGEQLAGALVRESLGDEFARRHAGHVSDPTVAIRERSRGRLTEPVQILQVVGVRQGRPGPVVGLEQIQGLTDGDPARRRHRHAVDVEAAVAAAGRGQRTGPVRAQVGFGDLTLVDRSAGLGGRLLGCLHHGRAEPASIQRLDAVSAQDPV